MKNIIKTSFLNADSKLRNGWWILIFIALIALTRPIYKPIKNGLSELGLHPNLLEMVSPALILLVTFLCLKMRKESFENVGLKLNLQWLKQFGFGVVAGLIMVSTLAAVIFIGGGVTFDYNPNFQLSILSLSLYLFFLGAFFEELLHRGFIFQRFIDGIGFWPAQLLIATIFAVGHWSNPGMEGAGKILGSADLFIGSLLFGLVYYKTKSLAMPIGLHLGWNWCMGSVFGFNVSGHEHAGVLTPTLTEMPNWFTGGEFGLEASVVSVLIGVICFSGLLLWMREHRPLVTG